MSDHSSKVETPILSIEEFKQFLEDSGMEYIPATEFEIPERFNLSKNTKSEADRVRLDNVLSFYKNFLRYPVITDDFKKGEHNERRKWKDSTYNKFVKEKNGDTSKAELYHVMFQQNKIK